VFTGLIEDIGVLRRLEKRGESAVLELETAIPTEELELGESIAVNGICLTVTSIHDRSFTVDASQETLSRTALSRLSRNDGVHLERAVRPSDRLGGHIVQGHVDGVGTVERVETHSGSWDIYIAMPNKLFVEVIEKGSIAVDGVSLTINDLTSSGIRLTIIPFTDAKTNLTSLKAGDPVNIETDVLGKYVRRFLSQSQPDSEKSNLKQVLIDYGYTDGDKD
jgi:riboflavin synthase